MSPLDKFKEAHRQYLKDIGWVFAREGRGSSEQGESEDFWKSPHNGWNYNESGAIQDQLKRDRKRVMFSFPRSGT